MKAEHKNHKDDIIISIAVMVPFFILSLQYLILVLNTAFFSFDNSTIQNISKIIVGLCFLVALPIVIKRSLFVFIVTYFIAITVFSFYYLVFPENRQIIQDILLSVFFMCLPSFVYCASIYDYNILKRIMRITSHLVLIIGIIFMLLVINDVVIIRGYSMSLSYYILLPAIIYITGLFKKFNLADILLSVVSLLIILSVGARGPVLCIIVFILIKLFLAYEKKTRTSQLMRLMIVLIVPFLYIFKDRLLWTLYDFFTRVGIESRSIYLFLLDETHLSSRDRIYEMLFREMQRSPISGLGLAGDRLLLGEYSYAHNFILEIVVHFGFILGIGILLAFFSFLFIVLLKSNSDDRNLIVVWISIGFVHLFVSSSYLTDLRFWSMFGIVTGIYLKQKTRSPDKLKKRKNFQLFTSNLLS